MNTIKYCQILSESLLGTLADQNISPSSIIFQQDNDPKHTSRMAQGWFSDNDIAVLPWPPSSPDMNIIEHVWDILDRRVRAWPRRPSNINELWEILQKEWGKISVETICALYLSVPRRLAALQKAKGGHTKY